MLTQATSSTEIFYSVLDESMTFVVNEHYSKLSKSVHPTQFIFPNETIVSQCLSSGLSIGAFHEGELIGCRLSYSPGLADENLGYFFSLPEDELRQTIQYQGTSVLPDYRGKGVGNELHKRSIQLIQKSEYRSITVTCHPDNKPSLHQLHKLGFKEDKQIHIVKGKERYVFLKRLEK
jgi:ribosomal protein S18 acetylase RimI-like enzyme